MNDFDYDIVQKKRVARGAFAHVNRKRGKCRLPSDYLTAAATYLADEMGCCSATIREYGEKLGVPFVRGGRNLDLWQKKLSEWHTAEVTAAETPEKQTDEIAPPARGAELLHARLTIRGDRESVLQNLRLLMPNECEVTVEW